MKAKLQEKRMARKATSKRSATKANDAAACQIAGHHDLTLAALHFRRFKERWLALEGQRDAAWHRRVCQDEAKIDRHRLLQGEQIKGKLIDFAFANIDQGLILKHHVAALQIAFNVCVASAVNRLLRQSAHTEQLFSEFIQSLLKAGAHYPNLPVM